MTARNLRIAGRGLLRVGYMADIIVFNPETDIYDNPQQISLGIERIYVNGVCAYRGGSAEPTVLARAGRMLSRASAD